MKRGEFKQELLNLFSQDIDKMSFQEKMRFIETTYIEFYASKDNEIFRDCSQKGKSWLDEELKIVLQDAPTKANCLKYAIIFKRGYGSIEQIYRWAATSDEDVKRMRRLLFKNHDEFISAERNSLHQWGLAVVRVSEQP